MKRKQNEDEEEERSKDVFKIYDENGKIAANYLSYPSIRCGLYYKIDEAFF